MLAFSLMTCQKLHPPVRPSARKPRSGLWSRWPLQPVAVPQIMSHPFSSLWKALTPCHACILLNRKTDFEPTCETRLPRSPGLACGAACPCKQSQVAHIVSQGLPFRAQSLLGLLCHACIHPEWHARSLHPPVRPVCPEAPVWPVEPLAPASTHNASHWVTCLLFSVQSSDSLMPCQHTTQWNARALTPPVRPVCPEAPVWPVEPLAPASTHNRLTLGHMPPLLCAKL